MLCCDSIQRDAQDKPFEEARLASIYSAYAGTGYKHHCYDIKFNFQCSYDICPTAAQSIHNPQAKPKLFPSVW